MLKIGLIGCGKAGQAVASALQGEPDLALRWIARKRNRVTWMIVVRLVSPLSVSIRLIWPTGWMNTPWMR